MKLEPLEEEDEDEKPLVEDEEVEEHLSSCLICKETKSKKVGELDKLPSLQGCQGNGSINQQLWSVFVLRNLAQYPREKMADLLKDIGGRRSMSDWLVLCETCGEIVKEAMVVFQKILKLETKFKNFQEKVKLRIINSLEGQENKDTMSVGTGDHLDVAEKIREHFKGESRAALSSECYYMLFITA